MFRLISFVIGYLFGGIQNAIVYSRLKGTDIRNHGSGNAGTTNVMRTFGRKAGLMIFALDVLKAAIAVVVARLIFKETSIVAGLYAAIGAIIGHSYPLFFGFKGGKGIAVTVGSIYMIDIRIGILVSIAFGISLKLTKMVSFSSMILTGLVPILLFVFYRNGSSFNFIGNSSFVEIVILGAVIAAITILRHKSNIERILNGTEAKVGQKKVNT
ncbi:MAG: acyl-phosphate glycerol 3-phosphate acyltransferase [Epulopiscium sp. Nuni2H_MBin001]|nr:MAG: acyl-phosphate glycerol 3-phosphate acyltransferase [Epulopiscium sp. Nuni2H_MBin001]